MAPSKIRKALGAVKDQTSIGLAKVSSSNTMSDLDVAIVKATRHEENPADERHIREILSLTCYSRAYISSCVDTLSKRLNKTKNWTVALKTLMLIHRLLLEGDSAYEQEIFFATRRGTRLLSLSDFRDRSRSGSWDFSAFVRTYALYLDEKLEFRMHGRQGRRGVLGLGSDEDHGDDGKLTVSVGTTPVSNMKMEQIFTRTQHLLQLLERFLACRPTGEAKSNRVVIVALYPVVKESFQIYFDITEIMGILVDRFMELEIPDCVTVHEIFTRIGKQFDDLELFYNWCKVVGLARSSEYPEVEKITSKKLADMNEFIRDKSALIRSKRSIKNQIPKIVTTQVEKEPEVIEEDINAIKALPAPEGFCENVVEVNKGEIKQKEVNTQKEANLLNLWDDNNVGSKEQGDRLALALFEGGIASSSTTSVEPAWEAFTNDDTMDWETALVQSASNLSNQKTSLGGGFDMLLLDGMYKQSAMATNIGAYGATGSASSVSLGSVGKPATMLALPAPPVLGGGAAVASGDPFVASISVMPPTYVQMSEIEKKQKLLMEEQLMWQNYARNGMQGNIGISQLQPNSYPMGGYTRSY